MTDYKAIELFLEEGNRSDAINGSLSRAHNKIDNQPGKYVVDLKNNSINSSKSYSWLLDGKQAIWDFKLWLERRRGRVQPFWMPSWKHEFQGNWEVRANEDGVSGRNIIVHESTNTYIQYYGYHPSRCHFIFFKPDGSYILNKAIESFTTVDRKIGIRMQSTFDMLYTHASFRMVSFLILCRLDADSIELFYHKTDCATVSANIVEVPWEVPN